MTIPSLTPVSTPPSTSDPTNFSTRGDDFLGDLPLLQTEINAMVAATNLAVAEVDADKTVAAASAATATAQAAAAVNAPGTGGSSTTSLAIGTGSKSLTTQTAKAWVVGQSVSLASAADPTKRMTGVITAYNSGTGAMDVLVSTTSGSGTHADWVIGLTAVSSIAGRHAIWIPATAMIPRTTNGASIGTVETTTNKVMVKTLDHDASTVEYAQFAVRMPKSWNEGTVSAVFEWSHPSTSVNYKVSWGIQAVAISDGEALEAAFGTAIYANDTGGTTDYAYASPETAAITVAGTPAAEDLVIFQVFRKADDATNDTLAVDARLHGVTLYITTDAENDG